MIKCTRIFGILRVINLMNSFDIFLEQLIWKYFNIEKYERNKYEWPHLDPE